MNSCQGPCLKHCFVRHGPAFAHLAIVYTMTCIFYLLLTLNIGTPLADSLSEEQHRIKRSSATKRATVFFLSVILSTVIVGVWKPFR